MVICARHKAIVTATLNISYMVPAVLKSIKYDKRIYFQLN